MTTKDSHLINNLIAKGGMVLKITKLTTRMVDAKAVVIIEVSLLLN